MLWEDQHYKIRHRLQPHILTSNGGHFNPPSYPPVSSPIHPRNQIQLQIYIKSIVFSVSWMRNKGGYKGLPIASVSIGIKCILKKKRTMYPGHKKKKSWTLNKTQTSWNSYLYLVNFFLFGKCELNIIKCNDKRGIISFSSHIWPSLTGGEKKGKTSMQIGISAMFRALWRNKWVFRSSLRCMGTVVI